MARAVSRRSFEEFDPRPVRPEQCPFLALDRVPQAAVAIRPVALEIAHRLQVQIPVAEVFRGFDQIAGADEGRSTGRRTRQTDGPSPRRRGGSDAVCSAGPPCPISLWRKLHRGWSEAARSGRCSSCQAIPAGVPGWDRSHRAARAGAERDRRPGVRFAEDRPDRGRFPRRPGTILRCRRSSGRKGSRPESQGRKATT